MKLTEHEETNARTVIRKRLAAKGCLPLDVQQMDALVQELDVWKKDNSRLREALMLLLDNVDYTEGACSVTEMVGAILPREILVKANQAKRLSLWGDKGKGTI